MSSLWNFKYSFFMFVSWLSLSWKSQVLSIAPFSPVSFEHEFKFLPVLTACHFLPKIYTERCWSCNISKIERICFLILLNKLKSINNSGMWGSTEALKSIFIYTSFFWVQFFNPLFKGSLSEKSFPVWKELGG